jgi:hypothetical protein
MASKNFTGSQTMLAGIGLGAGLVIAAIDNFAFKGEVSPFVIVAMLILVAAASGVIWGWRGWIVTIFAWVCVPLAHLAKHVLGLPDTLNPNTYPSILMLALFTFVVSTVGIVGGVFLRRLTKVGTKSNS